MNVKIVFREDGPVFFAYGLEGRYLWLEGLNSYIVSKVWLDNEVFVWFPFILEPAELGWVLRLEANMRFVRSTVLTDILTKGNEALASGQPVDLTDEFIAMYEKVPFKLFVLLEANPFTSSDDNEFLSEKLNQARWRLLNSMSEEAYRADKYLSAHGGVIDLSDEEDEESPPKPPGCLNRIKRALLGN